MAHELSRTQRRNLAKRQKPGNKPTRAERLVLYLRAAGVLSSAFSAATLMLLPDAFLYFIILVYAAILLWGADLFYELRGHGRAYQVPPLVVGSAFLVLFSLQFVLPKLHLTEFAWSTNGAYHAGMTVNGILWRSKFSDLHVTISNDSDYDYAQVSLLTGIRTDIPVDWFASTGGFRVRADALPAHSHIEMLFALSGIRTIDPKDNYVAGPWTVGKYGQFWFRWQSFELSDDYFLALKPHLDVVKIKGSYVAFYRRKYIRDTVTSSDAVSAALSTLSKTPSGKPEQK